MRRAPLALLVALSVSLAAPAQPKADPGLTAGVAAVGFPGLPGTVCVFGPKAFPVVTAPAGKAPAAVVAAGEGGGGRVVLFGHEGYLHPDGLAAADTAKLVANAVHWAARGKPTAVMVVGLPGTAAALEKAGLPTADLVGPPGGNPGVVIVRGAGLRPAEVPAYKKFLADGGGIVAGQPGWGWLQLNPGKSLADHPGNAVFAAAGLALAADALDTPTNMQLPVVAPDPLAHTAAAEVAVADAVKGKVGADLQTAEATLTRALRALPAAGQTALADRLGTLLAGVPDAVPSAKQPLKAGSPGRLALGLRTKLALDLPADRLAADRAAAAFPGSVPASAPRVKGRTVTVRTGVSGYIADGYGVNAKAAIWHSTGVYAAPGEVVRITVPAAAAGVGLGVRVGAHTDELWHLDRWQRAPQISRWFPLAAESTPAANPFGGLVYVTVPVGMKAGEVAVTIDGGVEAPVYFAGKTTAAEWARLRKSPAPWAEFVSDKCVLTVPAAAARTVENPAELTAFWDAVLDGCADLTGVPRARGRAERLVFDQQISAGYLHSGYPIMGPVSLAPLALDVPRMKRGGPGEGPWGFFHELGHNHQQREWTFGGTVEVTCNLYSLYLLETLCPGAPVHDEMKPPAQAKNAAKHAAAGSTFANWQKEPFVALIVYDQLRRSFGWDVYKKAIAGYHTLAAKDRPKDDAARRDEWVVRFSKAAGKNVAPAFAAWGVPVSDAAKAAVAGLPEWTPLPDGK